MHKGRSLASLIPRKQALWQLFALFPCPWGAGPLICIALARCFLRVALALLLGRGVLLGRSLCPVGMFRETSLPTKLLLTPGTLLSRPVTLPQPDAAYHPGH